METMALKRVGGTTIVALEGDVTRQAVEAVVNSANEELQHNEGVATAIVRTGGRVIQEESDTWIRQHGPVVPGTAAVTTGGMLQASHVIHAVGPYFAAGESDPTLAAAVTASLEIARERGLQSLAFPLISSGSRGYPPDLAAAVITKAVENWLEENPGVLTEVCLVGFDRSHAALFAACLANE
jgi:putative ATPase